MNFTLAQLRYLLAIDKHRSFMKASEECFVTQPTLSMQIKKLEENLNALLFDRSKHPLEPTEIGVEVINQAKKIVSEAEHLEAVLSNVKDEISGQVKIGIIPTLAPYLVPLFIDSFMKKYPDVSVKIIELTTQEIIYRLKEHDIDVGVAATPLKIEGIAESIVFYERFVAYVQTADEIASEKHYSVSYFENYQKWLLSEGNCLREQVISLCGIKHQSSAIGKLDFESASVSSLLSMVDTHGGVTFLPYLVTQFLSSERKKNIRLLSDEKYREISILSNSIYAKKPLIKALSKMIIASLPAEVELDKPGSIGAILPIDKKSVIRQ